MVFPQPDSPTRPSVSPGWMSKLTSCTARTLPLTPRKPPRTSKVFVRLRTESNASGLSAIGCCAPDDGRAPDELAGRDLLVAMAARQPAGIGVEQGGLGLADRDLERTTWCKTTAGLHMREIRRQAFDGFELRPARPVEPRHRAQQVPSNRDGAGGGTRCRLRLLRPGARHTSRSRGRHSARPRRDYA